MNASKMWLASVLAFAVVSCLSQDTLGLADAYKCKPASSGYTAYCKNADCKYLWKRVLEKPDDTWIVYRAAECKGDAQNGVTWSESWPATGFYKVQCECHNDNGNAPATWTDLQEVTVLDVQIDTPAQFPAYVCLAGDLDLASSAAPDGGTFKWSEVSGPGNATFAPNDQVQNPTFSADATGDYIVKVEYKMGGRPCSDTSGILRVIDDLTVVPAEAYVCINGTKDFYAWTCVDNQPQNVTNDATFSTSNGTMDGNTLTASGTPSTAVGSDWVKATYQDNTTDADHDCDLTVTKVEIQAFDRVPPGVGNGIDVNITVTPSLTGTGHNIQLDAIRTSGTSGSATVDPTTITDDATVTVTGGTQTSVGHANNVSLRGRLDGGSTCASEAFSVCAHVINFHQTVGQDAGNGVLHFEYEWESDSGNLADLDEVLVDEHVTYPNGNPYVPPDPPYDNWSLPNPTVYPTPPLVGTAGHGEEDHGHLGFSTPYSNQSFSGTQYYRFHCNRCMGAGGDRNQLAWGTILMGGITIFRTVEQIDDTWQYRINKSGVTATLTLP